MSKTKAIGPSKGGMPRFVPSDDERALVKLLTGNGYAQHLLRLYISNRRGPHTSESTLKRCLYSRVEGQDGRTMCILAEDHALDRGFFSASLGDPFFETGQHRLLVSRLDIDHPVRREPGQSECRRERVLAGHAPQHTPPRPCRDPGGVIGRPQTGQMTSFVSRSSCIYGCDGGLQL
jgi:hypothetical protein